MVTPSRISYTLFPDLIRGEIITEESHVKANISLSPLQILSIGGPLRRDHQINWGSSLMGEPADEWGFSGEYINVLGVIYTTVLHE